ncbi:MAG: glycosyltransferase family 2 protein, partial [Aquificota bacterium]
DLSRRVHKVSRTVFYPNVCIYHEWGRRSYKSLKLLLYHTKDAISYFNKWGWFFDKDRDEINRKILQKYR